MRCGGIAIALLAVLILPELLFAQYQAPSETLLISASRVATWEHDEANIVQAEGNVGGNAGGGVRIDMDRTHLSADNAVIWLTPTSGAAPGEQTATIALLGHAQLQQPEITRGGDKLIVTAQVKGTIRLVAQDRTGRDLSDSQIYRDGMMLRTGGEALPAVQATTGPATAPAATTRRAVKTSPILFHGTYQSITTTEGKLAIVFTNGVSLSRQERNDGIMEMQADRAVLFTTISKLREAQGLGRISAIEQAITAGYLEGDVRISHTSPGQSEQRLAASRVYYDFTTDRAYLTNAVIRTTDPRGAIPIVVRAQVVRQLSENEFRVKNAELTTSSFAVPSYSIRADKAYVREVDTGDPRYGAMTQFVAHDSTVRLYGAPVFYMPVIGGSFTQRGMAIRDVQIEDSKRFGFGVRTEWGVMEALGYLPPPDLDISMRADYFLDRGAALGVDADYGGGFVSEATRETSNFQGKFNSYIVPNDHGIDDLGRDRKNVPPEEEFRGRIRWQHQQFLPHDWQVQLQTGWVSDPNFLEEWFPGEFANGPPLESSFYAKKQKESEALTLLVSIQPNHIVTTSDLYQDVREYGPRIPGQYTSTNDHPFEIERLPELGYRRIGESLAQDKLTLFSDNTVSGNRFMVGKASLAQLGFRAPSAGREAVLPGIPALGTTGTTEDVVYRGDLRQEIDWPMAIRQLHFLPYVQGRYTGYTDSPEQGQINRLYAGAGVRINTAFWQIDETAQSDLFDVHRVRHVVEPEVHLFTSAQTVDRTDVFIYDSDVDAINDVSAASVALRQRWQTKRGGPGNERSVDFFTLSVEADWYTNKPPDSVIPPSEFRGLFIPSLPETSIPRDAINSEAMWRVSDSTVVLADAQWNMSTENLATASIGLAARRGDRLGYFVGTRYIEELNSAITTVALQYQLSAKYTINLRDSFDFGEQEDVYQSVSIQRKFDRFFVVLTVYHDEVDDNSGIAFSLFPEGLGRGVSSDALQNVFGGAR